MAKQLTHLPSHNGTIRTGRIAEPGEVITCRACRERYAFNLERARLLGRAAIKSATENWTPSGYVEMGAERYSGMIAKAAITHAQRIIDWKL